MYCLNNEGMGGDRNCVYKLSFLPNSGCFEENKLRSS
jgi:hypothetical protein